MNLFNRGEYTEENNPPEEAKEFTINNQKIFLFIEINNDNTYTVYQYFKSGSDAQTTNHLCCEYTDNLPENFSEIFPETDNLTRS